MLHLQYTNLFIYFLHLKYLSIFFINFNILIVIIDTVHYHKKKMRNPRNN